MMIYVFDTNSFREMSAFFPNIFLQFWENFNLAVSNGIVTSTKEVLTEINNSPNKDIVNWANQNKSLFPIPNRLETDFVAQIFQEQRFQDSVKLQNILNGKPAADPFVIARAKILKATVVTEEQYKIKGLRIPNICEHFNIDCTNLRGFIERQNWKF